jgi:hypothetical protein
MANDNVTEFTGPTRLKTPVPNILASAARSDLQDVIVIGWTQAGEMYFASSQASGPEVLWLLRQAEFELLAMRGDE